ncbi:MAG: class I SAM-dependent methyltransferase [Bacteroidales bacterium]|jgi:SAM-dependent methyltransferase|nr:class I SAM-dependent methyltransferase [Bacteroidales bacterium]
MEADNDTRIYKKNVDIDVDAIRSFWNKKAQKDSSLKAVLLGADFGENSGIIRNERESNILKGFIKNPKTVLDIGCGIGRWAYNLKSDFEIYHGIDFSEEFIKNATLNFKDFPNIKFFNMSVIDIDIKSLLASYNLIIITGVAMYINDNEIERLFYYLNKLSDYATTIYFQESISILPYRLTLKDFNSIELQSKYNAIYRTTEEYESYFSKYLVNYQIDDEKTGLLLDEETGARKETNARYWFLRRII